MCNTYTSTNGGFKKDYIFPDKPFLPGYVCSLYIYSTSSSFDCRFECLCLLNLNIFKYVNSMLYRAVFTDIGSVLLGNL